MANPKMIGAIMVALLAIGLDTAASKSLWEIGKILRDDMDRRLSLEDQADAEKAFSFAKQIIVGMAKESAEAGQELMTAWDAVLHHPDQCNEFSFGYVARIERCYPSRSSSMTTLTEATRKYASRCLTPDYIAKKIESETRGNGCSSTSCSKTKDVKFIDDQLIADYWSENPKDGRFMDIDVLRASTALAKALIRDPKRKIKGLKKRKYVHAYLKEHLYKPCFNYASALRRVMEDMVGVSLFLEGRYEKLISSLDKNTQDVIFRYELCNDISVFKQANEISSEVASQLKGLSAI